VLAAYPPDLSEKAESWSPLGVQVMKGVMATCIDTPASLQTRGRNRKAGRENCHLVGGVMTQLYRFGRVERASLSTWMKARAPSPADRRSWRGIARPVGGRRSCRSRDRRQGKQVSACQAWLWCSRRFFWHHLSFEATRMSRGAIRRFAARGLLPETRWHTSALASAGMPHAAEALDR